MCVNIFLQETFFIQSPLFVLRSPSWLMKEREQQHSSELLFYFSFDAFLCSQIQFSAFYPHLILCVVPPAPEIISQSLNVRKVSAVV